MRRLKELGDNVVMIGSKLYFVDKSDAHGLWLHELWNTPERPGVLAEHYSPFQRIQIIDTKQFGKALVLDGFPQISVATNPEYTESMVGPALLWHEKPERVLILGGGDGAALALAHKNPWVKHITLVEIDRAVMNLTQKHMPELWDGAHLDEQRVRIIGGDALKFLRETDEFFDIVISDLTDPDEGALSTPLMNIEYFKLLRSRLYLSGLLAMQAGNLTKFDNKGHRQTRSLVESVFTELQSYRVYVPWFSTTWSFILASKERSRLPAWNAPLAKLRIDKFPSLSRHFKYLTPETLTAMFAIDPEIPLR